MSTNTPDIDPANNGSLAGSMKFAFQKMMQNTNGMLPAKVIAFDRTTNRVQVQLLISILTTSGATVPRQQLASLPVLILGGGGYMLNFNLVEGDLGWVAASDRDISLFLQSYSEAAPNTARMFSFSDGLFIPDVMKGYTISGGDADNAVLQNLSGTVKIALTPSGVQITSPTVTLVNGAMTVTGVFTAGGLTLTGGAGDIVGNLHVVGAITATGSITPFVP